MSSTKLDNFINLIKKEEKYLSDLDKEKLIAEANDDNLEFMKKKTLHRMSINANKRCLHCGELIKLKTFIVKLDRMKFCKTECNTEYYNNSRRKNTYVTCTLCGKDFIKKRGPTKKCPDCIAKLKAEAELAKKNIKKVDATNNSILTREMRHDNIMTEFTIRQGNIYDMASKNFFKACTMQIKLDEDIAKYNFERMTRP